MGQSARRFAWRLSSSPLPESRPNKNRLAKSPGVEYNIGSLSRLGEARGLDLMPIYVYECTNCGLHFERHQRIADDPVHVCPECAGRVQRVIQPVGVVFKGSGFYVTDNRRSSGGSSRMGKPSTDTSSNGKADSTEPSPKKSESEKSQSKV